MAAATITTRIPVRIPDMEVVVLTADDTDTFVSEKFATVLGVQATFMEDMTTMSIPISCDVSGATVTLNCTGLSGKLVCLTLYGKFGN